MDTATADAHFAAWMRVNLYRAAEHFGLTVSGDPVFGWRLRSISARVTGPDGARWLRVVSQEPEWASGDHWTGTVEANAVRGVRKRRVPDSVTLARTRQALQSPPAETSRRPKWNTNVRYRNRRQHFGLTRQARWQSRRLPSGRESRSSHDHM